MEGGNNTKEKTRELLYCLNRRPNGGLQNRCIKDDGTTWLFPSTP